MKYIIQLETIRHKQEQEKIACALANDTIPGIHFQNIRNELFKRQKTKYIQVFEFPSNGTICEIKDHCYVFIYVFIHSFGNREFNTYPSIK